MTDKQIEAYVEEAKRYAKANASTRCAKMGDCSGCSVRNCDYRTAARAFMAGVVECYDRANRKQDGAE